jgi:uridylate kinase
VRWRTALLKLSGEALGGASGQGLDVAVCRQIASEIAGLHAEGVRLGVVIGGGNICRGAAFAARGGLNRPAADAAGMLATAINSLALQGFLEEAAVPTALFSANAIDKVAPAFTAAEGRRQLASGRVVIIAGGTGNPFFTTDTAAALRCAELGAEVLLKATKVDGIYDSDPATHPQAIKLGTLSYADALSRGLRIMDATAFSFCMEQSIPIVVFKLLEKGNLRRALEGATIGSIVTKGG